MTETASAYYSYLLRLWREDRNDESIWRASLESAQTREQHNFATLDELIAFLHGLLVERAGPNERRATN
jgi:hypothetical protein